MLKYEIYFTRKIKKDLVLLAKRGKDMAKFEEAVEILASGKTPLERYRDHALTGNWRGYRDCHIEPDWLLLYRIDGEALILELTRTGSHADLLD